MPDVRMRLSIRFITPAKAAFLQDKGLAMATRVCCYADWRACAIACPSAIIASA
jgi:hypothetical protein